jgi:cell division protease FtsH
VPSYSKLLQDIRSGRVKDLELAPRARLVRVVYSDGQQNQVPVFNDNQQLLRTAEQAQVPLSVKDERSEDAMAGLVGNLLLVLLLFLGLGLLLRRSAQVANKALGFGRSSRGCSPKAV